MYAIQEVLTKRDEQRFLDLARDLYANDEAWVCPLDMEVRKVFDPASNPKFQDGEAARWLLLDGNGKVVGRIGAFFNRKRAAKFQQPTGGCGFFECINDQKAANLLFDAARDWLKAKGMEAMDGPVNFGENDRFWGLLVDGFTQSAYGMPYNPPYYQALFENYGFHVYFKQSSKLLDLTKPFPERFIKIFEWVKQKPGVRFEHIQKKNIMKYGLDLMTVYNDAWQHHEHFTPLTEKQIAQLAKDLSMIIVEEMIVFAYIDNEPAGFVVCLPDLNQIFKPMKGKMGIISTFQFLWRKRNAFAWYRKQGILNRARVLLMGVRPKFQKYGLESGLCLAYMDDAKKMGFKEIELSWVGDFNPKMQAILDATGASAARMHFTYRYLFNGSDEIQTAHTIE